jgi:hypothetical protein
MFRIIPILASKRMQGLNSKFLLSILVWSLKCCPFARFLATKTIMSAFQPKNKWLFMVWMGAIYIAIQNSSGVK